MSRNHRYEQIPSDNHFEATLPLRQSIDNDHTTIEMNQTSRSSGRTDLEETFDLDHDSIVEEEHAQLLPTSRVDHSPTVHLHQHSNDGVFSNMSAKPDTNVKLGEEVPPAYEEALADATPPYLQTTIFTPELGDVVLVDGLPVGSIFSFLWNLMVSASFQFVGFALTFLLHTTHAAKNGSQAGLGITFIQYGFYVRSRGTMDEDFDYDGEGHETVGHDAVQANIVSYVVMLVGWLIVLKAVSDFIKTRKMEKIITTEPNLDHAV